MLVAKMAIMDGQQSADVDWYDVLRSRLEETYVSSSNRCHLAIFLVFYCWLQNCVSRNCEQYIVAPRSSIYPNFGFIHLLLNQKVKCLFQCFRITLSCNVSLTKGVIKYQKLYYLARATQILQQRMYWWRVAKFWRISDSNPGFWTIIHLREYNC